MFAAASNVCLLLRIVLSRSIGAGATGIPFGRLLGLAFGKELLNSAGHLRREGWLACWLARRPAHGEDELARFACARSSLAYTLLSLYVCARLRGRGAGKQHKGRREGWCLALCHRLKLNAVRRKRGSKRHVRPDEQLVRAPCVAPAQASHLRHASRSNQSQEPRHTLVLHTLPGLRAREIDRSAREVDRSALGTMLVRP